LTSHELRRTAVTDHHNLQDEQPLSTLPLAPTQPPHFGRALTGHDLRLPNIGWASRRTAVATHQNSQDERPLPTSPLSPTPPPHFGRILTGYEFCPPNNLLRLIFESSHPTYNSIPGYQRQGAYRLRPVWLLSTSRPKQLALITNEIVEGTRSALRDRDAFFPAREGTNPESIATVRRALVGERPLSIAYQALGDSEPHRRLVEPLRLEERGQLYYLYAYRYREEANRVFRLDRLLNVKLTRRRAGQPYGIVANSIPYY
jgi:hypothetical protein